MKMSQMRKMLQMLKGLEYDNVGSMKMIADVTNDEGCHTMSNSGI